MKNFPDDFPTLGKISLDILPIPASSVPCERLFSGAKEVATEHCLCLGAEHFEQLQIMKSAWKNQIGDLVAVSTEAEVVDLRTFLLKMTLLLHVLRLCNLTSLYNPVLMTLP